MGTISREFYGQGGPNPTSNDGAYGTDIRKLFDANPGANTDAATIARFPAGSGANAEIVLDPVTARTTLGVVNTLGWAVNFATADGMQSVANAKRVILAGAWRFRGRITPPATARDHRPVFRVYRVAAAPGRARTLLFTFTAATRNDIVGYNFDYTTAAQVEIVLEADESIQVSPAIIQNTNDALLQHEWAFGLGSGALGEAHWQVTVPAPGVRTDYFIPDFRPLAAGVGAGITPRPALQSGIVRSVNVPAVTPRPQLGVELRRSVVAATVTGFARALTLARSFAVIGAVIPTVRKRTGKPFAAIGAVIAPTAIKQVSKPFSAVVTTVTGFARQLTLGRAFTSMAAGVSARPALGIGLRRVVPVATMTARPVLGIAMSREVVAAVSVDLRKQIGKPVAAIAAVVPTMDKVLGKAFAAVAATIPAFQRALRLARMFTIAVAVASVAFVKMRVELIPGGAAVIRKIQQFIFDD